MANFALFVRFSLREGMEEAFDALVKETEAGIRAHEPGTLVYACLTVEGAPNERIFFEIYADRAAFDEHERQPHTLRFLSERTQYVEKTDVDWLEPYAGKYPREAAK
ncbi:putative quinol monooxygenase [Streptomyces olivochromogenes]|uniref:Antibiotic biosynthesis monooxygenase n=1 Tax=Streptomyces olivochromogenes TaxID=1963 RepID=A0A250V7M7_STROL|nr:antibiotic biosynthesis monooxygenase [Streptomyces olivochromogenes]KUN45654.1 antibiotic biosynthesis monooxygenase [Streptomyces olivochromogenes]GAX50187.1 antibiotic biosynthesis monooxygenase [Streptomyces olivochromogenes]